jgi:hypothetical protein
MERRSWFTKETIDILNPEEDTDLIREVEEEGEEVSRTSCKMWSPTCAWGRSPSSWEYYLLRIVTNVTLSVSSGGPFEHTDVLVDFTNVKNFAISWTSVNFSGTRLFLISVLNGCKTWVFSQRKQRRLGCLMFDWCVAAFCVVSIETDRAGSKLQYSL